MLPRYLHLGDIDPVPCLVVQVLTGWPAAAAGTWDLGKEGFPYAITMGPYGQVLALCWQREAPGQPTHMVLLAAGPGEASQGDPGGLTFCLTGWCALLRAASGAHLDAKLIPEPGGTDMYMPGVRQPRNLSAQG